MKKLIQMAIIAACLGLGTAYAEKMDSTEYCDRHCSAAALKKEISALEQEIKMNKASSAGGADKLAIIEAKKKAASEHLNQHIKELNDLKSRLAEIEKK